MRPVTELYLHCSYSPCTTSIDTIDEWHKEKGFSRTIPKNAKNKKNLYIGYHFIVRSDGITKVGRDEEEIGSHCQGHNAKSLGICLPGWGEYSESLFEEYLKTMKLKIMSEETRLRKLEKFKSECFTEAQIKEVISLFKQLMSKYNLGVKAVKGHYEVDLNGKTCPNLNMDIFREKLKGV